MFAENSLLSSSRNPLITEFFSDTFNYEFPFLPSLPLFLRRRRQTRHSNERSAYGRLTEEEGEDGIFGQYLSPPQPAIIPSGK